MTYSLKPKGTEKLGKYLVNSLETAADEATLETVVVMRRRWRTTARKRTGLMRRWTNIRREGKAKASWLFTVMVYYGYWQEFGTDRITPSGDAQTIAVLGTPYLRDTFAAKWKKFT